MSVDKQLCELEIVRKNVILNSPIVYAGTQRLVIIAKFIKKKPEIELAMKGTVITT